MRREREDKPVLLQSPSVALPLATHCHYCIAKSCTTTNFILFKSLLSLPPLGLRTRLNGIEFGQRGLSDPPCFWQPPDIKLRSIQSKYLCLYSEHILLFKINFISSYKFQLSSLKNNFILTLLLRNSSF